MRRTFDRSYEFTQRDESVQQRIRRLDRRLRELRMQQEAFNRSKRNEMISGNDSPVRGGRAFTSFMDPNMFMKESIRPLPMTEYTRQMVSKKQKEQAKKQKQKEEWREIGEMLDYIEAFARVNEQRLEKLEANIQRLIERKEAELREKKLRQGVQKINENRQIYS